MADVSNSCHAVLNRHSFPATLATCEIDDKATQLHAIASLKVLLDVTKSQNGKATSASATYVNSGSNELIFELQEAAKSTTSVQSGSISGVQYILNGQISIGNDSGLESEEDENHQEALNMMWPTSSQKRITYVLVAPILFPLWLTLPDTRTPK
ncbi:sodium/potassium/calcium exchanger Nckx30C-like, partial [Copidosoma floridanum]|uniref:sodium/potassium/calcium exchanger Nckx30C-like n=1 Tax=Copidosoma floridanum TaxID=29053 RepID=UPI0006C9A7C3